jgi:REP element-mobilizing transposase RayT
MGHNDLVRHNKIELYIHLIWATWNREPVIHPEMERDLYRDLAHQAAKLDCENLAIGGVEDHVHMLVKIPATVTVAELAKQLKGSTSYLVNHQSGARTHLKWQGSYCALSASRWDVKKITRYIQNQKQHHQAGTTKPALEMSDDATQFD